MAEGRPPRQQFQVVSLQDWWNGYGDDEACRLPLVDIRESNEEFDKEIEKGASESTPTTAVTKRLSAPYQDDSTCTENTRTTVVSLPFSTLVSGERSCELPPRHVSFALLMEERLLQQNQVQSFFGATVSKATQQSRQPWHVPQILLDTDELWEQVGRMGLSSVFAVDNNGKGKSRLPQPRLWQPDAMVERVLWPLLRERLIGVSEEDHPVVRSVENVAVETTIREIWDLGSGAGRDVCYLAEQIQLLEHSNDINMPSCRVLGLDHHKASPKRCLPFWRHRGVYPNHADSRLLDLRKLDIVSQQMGTTPPVCVFAVRFYEPKLIRFLAETAPLPPDTLFAMSHFCKPSVGATWDFDHPKEKSVLDRDELATLFRASGRWTILYDVIASDGDHGRTLIHFVARRRTT